MVKIMFTIFLYNLVIVIDNDVTYGEIFKNVFIWCLGIISALYVRTEVLLMIPKMIGVEHYYAALGSIHRYYRISWYVEDNAWVKSK